MASVSKVPYKLPHLTIKPALEFSAKTNDEKIIVKTDKRIKMLNFGLEIIAFFISKTSKFLKYLFRPILQKSMFLDYSLVAECFFIYKPHFF